jgi:methyl coenzyme M reductase beta subunit
MRQFGVSAAMLLGVAATTYTADALAFDMVKAAPAMVTKATSQPATCGSVEDFVVTNCQLTWNGITVYGTIDGGVTWRSHGAPFNGASAVGSIISSTSRARARGGISRRTVWPSQISGSRGVSRSLPDGP